MMQIKTIFLKGVNFLRLKTMAMVLDQPKFLDRGSLLSNLLKTMSQNFCRFLRRHFVGLRLIHKVNSVNLATVVNC